MFVRSIELELEKWAFNPYRKPLVLRGARQVGKTTVVNRFGKQFDNYLYINLEKISSKQLIESTDDVKTLTTIVSILQQNKERR